MVTPHMDAVMVNLAPAASTAIIAPAAGATVGSASASLVVAAVAVVVAEKG